MDIVILVLLFIFGTLIGSFLNVVILRFNTGKGLNGRSACMSCGKKLVWYELFPVFSYLFLGGRCSKCRTNISWQYPLVEGLTGFLFVLVYMTVTPVVLSEFVYTVFYLIITCILIVISVYDIKHKIIPDPFVFAFIALAFVGLFLGHSDWFVIPTWSQMLAGPLLALPFAIIWYVSKGTWMGFGDAKLVVGIGWILGMGAGANAIVLAFWIAAIISIGYLLIVKHSIKPRTEIPFGPYLIIGMYVVLFYKIQVIDFSLLKEIVFSLF